MGREIVEGRLRPQRAVMYHQGCSSSSSASFLRGASLGSFGPSSMRSRAAFTLRGAATGSPLAPPGRVRGVPAPRDGSGALGEAIIQSSYSLEASGTRQRAARARAAKVQKLDTRSERALQNQTH